MQLRSTNQPDTHRRAIERWGGIAALIEAGTFIVGIVMFASMLTDYTTGDPTPAESVAFLADNQTALRVWYVVTLIVFGIVLVPLTLAIGERLRDSTPMLSKMSVAFGLIWSGLVLAGGMVANIGITEIADRADTDPVAAESLWSAVDTVLNGLTGGNEVVGGVWVLIISVAALASGALPRTLNALGIVAGIAGLVTVAPGMEAFEMVFGTAIITWLVAIGSDLIRTRGDNSGRVPATAGDTAADTAGPVTAGSH